MKKKELLNRLEEAAKTEESATILYLKHLDAIISRLNVKEDFILEAKQIINYLIEWNKKHKIICEEMIAKVEKENQNDF